MDLYVWVMHRKGFDVADVGYFFYCDGDRFSQYDFLGQTDAHMRFEMSLIPYEVDQTWIEPTLSEIRNCLEKDDSPAHADRCEYGTFLQQVNVSRK